jgi:prepilin peptidase CpaA
MNFVYIVVIAIGLVACVTDLKTRRIPNLLTLGSAVAALVFHVATGGIAGAVSAAGGWIIAVILFAAPFALGGMGAGDLKLLGALGAWLGPSAAFWLALYTGTAGGVVAILLAAVRGYLPQMASNIQMLLTHWRVVGIRPLGELTIGQSRSPKLAYAVPILIGTLVTVWLR